MPMVDEESIQNKDSTDDSAATSHPNTNRDVFVLDTSSLTDIDGNLIDRGRKSSTPNNSRQRSSTPVSPTVREKLPKSRNTTRPNTPMQVDDDSEDDNYYDDIRYKRTNEKSSQIFEDERYLTTEKFNYTMKLLDEKINSLYRLLRHVSDQQQKDSNTIQRLVVIDELSDEFWNVSYFNIFSNFILTQILTVFAGCL